MKVFELLSINKELLNKILQAGIKPDDYRYVDLYRDFVELKQSGEKVTYIVAHLATQYQISERQVYNLVERLGKDYYCMCHAGE